MPSASLCLLCTGTCCRFYNIDIKIGDISRLVKYLGIGFAKAAKLFVRRGIDGDLVIHKQNGACFFLEGGLCSVYAARPGVCRNFMPPKCLDDKVARRQKGVDPNALRAEIKRIRHATR